MCTALIHQSHIRLFLIIVIKVGKVYSSSKWQMLNIWTITFSLVRKKNVTLSGEDIVLEEKLMQAVNKNVNTLSRGNLQIISEILISSVSR